MKNVRICFTFLMSGHAHVLISPARTTAHWPQSGCKDFPLEEGHYFIFYTGASAGGGSISVSVDGTMITTQHFGPGSFSSDPIVITI